MTLNKLAAALVAAGVLGVGVAPAFTRDAGPPTAAPAPVTAPAALPGGQIARPDFSVLVDQYGPAVVHISVVGEPRAAGMQRLPDGIPMPQIPGMPFGPHHDAPRSGQGSGFIVSADGLILTNAHVVDQAREVNVTLTDRREYRAKVLGSDRRTDVAVLKIDAKNLPTVRLGQSEDVKVGEWVIAIGSPYGLESSVSVGVVSATGRSLPRGAAPFIQTDAALNPGNSGGPLFNSRGEVVGINSQIYSRTGGYQGLSFAIPIDLAVRIKDQIVANGKVEHARLGVTVQDLNQQLADSFGLPRPGGALISSVEANSPAARAGLQSGDIVRQANGRPVVRAGDLTAIIGMHKPGDTVEFDVWRKRQTQTVTAQLGALEPSPAQTAATKPAGEGRLGLAVRPVQPGEVKGVESGLLVEQAGGASAAAGVRPGDVIVSVNGVEVSDPAEVRKLVEQADKSVALLVQRGDSRIFVPVRVS
ncbi:MAG TPA: Do family serine endopeptidase [Burkholderiaceae bacterium]|nr:Do family serine endopeptidase [Burkholderiaceae bacterium]